MGFRFRKSIKLAPGIRVNLSPSGASLSAGVRGASVTMGPRGTHVNAGLPGTGLSYRSRVGGGPNARPSRGSRSGGLDLSGMVRMALGDVELDLDERGYVVGTNQFGHPLEKKELSVLWKTEGEAMSDWLHARRQAIEGGSYALARVHHDTPNPSAPPSAQAEPFDVPPPAPPPPSPVALPPPGGRAPAAPSFWQRLIPVLMRRYEQRERQAEEAFERAVAEWSRASERAERDHADRVAQARAARAEWEAERDRHASGQQAAIAARTSALRGDSQAMDDALAAALESAEWARETLVSFELHDDGRSVWLDVDLPEVEHVPPRRAELAVSGRKLNIRDKSDRQVREEYAAHIHGIVVRLAGIVLSALPAADRCVVSGFSQRLDEAVGIERDEYLISALIDRPRFAEIDFGALDRVDPIAAVERFDPVRDMTKTGIFRPIEPLSPDDE